MKLNKLYILLSVFILALPLASAVKPQTNIVAEAAGLTIRFPPFEYVIDTAGTANFHVYNSSFNRLNGTQATCELDIYNTSGTHIVNNNSLSYNAENGDFFYNIKQGLFIVNREYAYTIDCNSSNEAGFVSHSFLVIDRVSVSRPEGESNLLVVIILLPLIFGIFLLVGAVTLGEDHAILKIFLYILSLFTVLSSFHFGMVGAVNYLNLDELEGYIGSTVYWITIILFAILAYFLIYFIIKIFAAAAQDKEDKLNY